MARYDLHVQSLTREEQGFSSKIFTMLPEDTFGVKGMQWLINMWLKILFTRQGSDPTNTARGTGFTNLIGSSMSLADAEDAVRLCIEQCNEQLFALQQNDTTLAAKERLASAKLFRYTSDPSAPGFEAYVEIMNEAGERLPVDIPRLARR